MSYIDQWLTGLGLEYVIPKLKEQGITTPKKLATLSLREMYEVVGVEDAEDRKKLYYLIQRLQTILKKEASKKESEAGSKRDDAKDSGGTGSSSSSSKETKTEARTKEKEAAVPETVSPGNKSSPDSVPAAKPSSSVESLSNGVANMKISPLRRRGSQDSADDGVKTLLASTDGSAASDQSEEDLSILRRRRRESSGDDSKAVPAAAAVPAPRPSRLSMAAADPKSASAAADKLVADRSKQRSAGVPRRGSVPVPAIDPMAAPAVASSSPDSLSGGDQKLPTTKPTPSVTNGSRNKPQRHVQPPASQEEASTKGTSGVKSRANRRASSAAALRDPSPIESSADREQTRNARVPPPRRHSSAVGSGSQRGVDRDDPGRQSRDGVVQLEAQKGPYQQRPRSSSNAEDKDAALQRLREKQEAMRKQREANRIDGEVGNMDDGDVEDMAIRVVVRKRPISRSETEKGDYDVMEVVRRQVLLHQPMTKVDLTKVIETQTFTFDDAFAEDQTNEGIYRRTIKPLVTSVFEGAKASCFAYGQTGSGKTFTMMGANPANPNSVTRNAGLYVLAARDVFEHLATGKYDPGLVVKVSCFEIYGGKLFDLLNERQPVKCLEDGHGKVQIRGIKEHEISSVVELLGLMAQAHELRSTGSTGANLESSRSHQVLQITVGAADVSVPRGRYGQPAKSQSKGPKGKLSFIDLAGSERGADTSNNSKQTRMEGAEINTSLLALKEVIRSRELKLGHTPFRGSKLTQVLKDSFIGENTRTCMIACVSPSHSNCEHTLNTLRYADRVKEHESRPDAAAAPAAAPGAGAAAVSSDSSRRSSTGEARRPSTAGGPRDRGCSPHSRGNSPGPTRPGSAPSSSSSSSPSSPSRAAGLREPAAEKVLDTVDEKGESGTVSLGSTGLIQRTFDLLSAHKLAIAEMVEVMKDEMELVQRMEQTDERETEDYINRLEKLLLMKRGAVETLHEELHSFQQYRTRGGN